MIIDVFSWPWLQEMTQLFIAGLCGGLVRWGITMEPWRQALRIMGVGAMSAAFLGRLAMPLLGEAVQWSGGPPEYTPMLAGFVVGVGGLLIPTLVMDTLARRRQLVIAGAPPEPIAPAPADPPAAEGG